MLFKTFAVTRIPSYHTTAVSGLPHPPNLPPGLTSAPIFPQEGHITAMGSVPSTEPGSAGFSPENLDLPCPQSISTKQKRAAMLLGPRKQIRGA